MDGSRLITVGKPGADKLQLKRSAVRSQSGCSQMIGGNLERQRLDPQTLRIDDVEEDCVGIGYLARDCVRA